MIEILPYAEVNGAWSVPDSSMMAVWARLELDGTAGIVFSDHEITDGQQFVSLAKNPGNLLQLVVVDKKIGGVGWVNGLHKDRAFAHYAFFKSQWGKNTIKMAEALVSYWFNDAFPFQMLIGQTPEWNRKAVKFLERIGWTVIGRLPETPGMHALIISYVTKERFNGRQEQRQERQ